MNNVLDDTKQPQILALGGLGWSIRRIEQSRRRKDAPQSRPVMAPALGPVVALREVGGLHHRYERRAA